MCLIMTAEGWQNLGDGKVCSNHNDLQGVYRPVSLETARSEAQIRVDQFCRVVEDGNITAIKNFNGHRLYGAFGEAL